MPAPLPTAIVIVACKVSFTPMTPLEAHNYEYTGYAPFEWRTEGSKMQCRRHEIQLTPVEGETGDFTMRRCMRSAIAEHGRFNYNHKNSNWRAWSVSCPTPIVDTRTGEVIAWKMPQCGRRDVVECEIDTAI